MNDVWVALKTCDERWNTGDYWPTLKGLLHHDLIPLPFRIPKHVESRPWMNCGMNDYQILSHFKRFTDARFLLYVEDDAGIGEQFREVLETAVAADFPITTFYISGLGYLPKTIQKLIAEGIPIPPGFYSLPRGRFMGSVCLLLRRDFAEHLSAIDWHFKDAEFNSWCGGLKPLVMDWAVKTESKKLGHRIQIYIPNPVINLGNHRSTLPYQHDHAVQSQVLAEDLKKNYPREASQKNTL
jgi:hypothetical protein